ncbi:glycosyltransferase [Scytonema hofmannii]|uniref:glycosyltransferase n=1 Tax=Scytonema hofmannii TaxID=34078 RepID=UPI0011E048C6|nr:glycosyltransferase [Scytonema hofmannii]
MRRTLYVQYTNPAGYPPLEHSSRILANDGWEVLFLGTGSLGSNSLCFPLHNGITVRQLPFCPGGWRQKLHYLWFCLWVIYWAFRFSPQWVYASDFLSCPIALLLSTLPGVKLIYHEHDSPNALEPSSAFIRLCMKTRKWVAQRAQICILPNQQRIERFIQDTKPTGDVLCVWNCPAQEEISPPRLPYKNNEVSILYHGSIGPSRLPPSILVALAQLPVTVKLRVIGYETKGSQGYVEQLKELAHELVISERIEFLGPMPRKELFKWCQKSDIGLAFMPLNSKDINMEYMVGASNKAFDYLACGLAIIVSNLQDWRKMYVETGYGLCCQPDNADSISTTLNWFLENPEQMRQMGESGRRQIFEQWNYEQQFIEIYKIMCLLPTKRTVLSLGELTQSN